ncbi:MAG: XRE family transcriptional regulator [Spirochaetes bacterium]|jgi:transcriptional regulator with XRE-family HTH domain|nr:MAG: XRE family transcriptional regulator [Spirochaetota bacterium]
MPDVVPWTALINAREERGWSRFHLASVMRINLSHLGKLERGESKPRTGTVSRAAQALGIPVSQLMSAVGNARLPVCDEQQFVTRKEMESYVHRAVEKALRERG